MSKWLVKSEPDVYSIDDLQTDKTTCWDNVRNYEARNNLQRFAVGDLILYYHSNAEPSGIAGICKVAKAAYPDPSQFDRKSEYFDPKATIDAPRWFSPELRFVAKFPRLIELSELRTNSHCQAMILLKRGSRLSVQPVSEKEFAAILRIAGVKL